MNDALTSSGSEQPYRGPDTTLLLSLLREATEGSDELDDEIMEIVADSPLHMTYRGKYGWRFTRSLDAAAVLVPAGWFWRVGHTTSFAGWAFVNKEFDDDRTEFSFGKRDGTTPAIALCVAALLANAHLLKSVPSLSPTPARRASSQESLPESNNQSETP